MLWELAPTRLTVRLAECGAMPVPSASLELAKRFRELHDPGSGMLIAPAVGDAAMARICQECGARAILTSSATIANTFGYADGEAFASPEAVLSMIRRIVAVVAIPVSADMEAGYGDPVGFAEEVIKAGAIGVNLEDRVGDETSPRPLEEAASRVAAVREAADRAGIPLFINARTDTVILGGDLDDAIRRLNAYLEAGADCTLPMLPIELRNTATVATLANGINGRLNIGGYPPTMTIDELEALGVCRISVPILGAVYRYTRSLVARVLDEKTLEPLREQDPYMEVNQIFRQLQGGTADGGVMALLTPRPGE